MKPSRRPVNPCFSSGPCAKRPGWSPAALSAALVGRSHRSAVGLKQLVEIIERSRAVLDIPSDYRVGVVPASDTGAIEMAMWSLLGARGVDVLSWENFGESWVEDIAAHLKLPDIRHFAAPYGKLPDLGQVDTDRDVVFVWNGTTSGVRVPNGDWIATDRKGLTLCDATSAAFAIRLPWDRLDVVTWSWQRRWAAKPARHDRARPSRGRAAGKLHAVLAAAENLPDDPKGQADRRHFPRRDDQHAVDAVRRGCARFIEMGRKCRRARGLRRAGRGQFRRRRNLGRAHAVGRVPCRGAGDPVVTPRRASRSSIHGSNAFPPTSASPPRGGCWRGSTPRGSGTIWRRTAPRHRASASGPARPWK